MRPISSHRDRDGYLDAEVRRRGPEENPGRGGGVKSRGRIHAPRQNVKSYLNLQPPNRLQQQFDFGFGVFLPILLLLCDPLVFKGNLPGDSFPLQPALLSSYQKFAYIMTGFEMATLSFWLIYWKRLSKFSGFFSVILICGGVLSLFIGFRIILFSIWGILLMLTGNLLAPLVSGLGFIPFLTSLVYFRNGVRAFSCSTRSNMARILSMALGVLLIAFQIYFFFSW